MTTGVCRQRITGLGWLTLLLYRGISSAEAYCMPRHVPTSDLLRPFRKETICRSLHLSRRSYEDERDYYSPNDAYWESPQAENPVYFQDSYYESPRKQEDDQLVWERVRTDSGDAQVLLPPPSVQRPSAVVHFVGGTLFGSAPNLWYQQLLEDLVKHTQSAVVATTLPVTLTRSPLQHVDLAQQVQRQFQTAWREVLLDEYGDEISNVPVCGMGHSLGSRLLIVMSTLGDPPVRPFLPPAYKAMVLISFTNYGAAAGIPGIQALAKTRKKMDRDQRLERPQRRRRDDWYDEEVDEDDWGDIFEDLQRTLSDGARKVQSALTPQTKDLEFFPSPDQLWKALQEDRRYRVPQSLVVQFDDDIIDQSSKLAVALKESSSVRFARIRGTHLSPVSAGSSRSEVQKWNNRVGSVLQKVLVGRTSRASDEARRELRQCMARYITEVVTK